MPSKVARRTIWIVVAAGLFLLAFIALIPFIASTQIVRNRIAQELSEWSGYRVVLRGAPRIRVWPAFHAELADVAFLEWGGQNVPPVLQSERIEAELSPIAALRGDIAFTRIKLLRPLVRVVRVEGGERPVAAAAAPVGGRMVRAIRSARTAVAANPTAPDLSGLPSDPLGTVEFIDGRLVRVDAAGDHEILSSINGRATWPTLDRAATVSFKTIWRGETVAVEAGIQQPLALLGGGSSQVSLTLAATPLSGTYDGTVTLSQEGFVDGTAKLSSPSLRRTLEWIRADIAPGSALGEASVGGRVIGNSTRMKIEDANLAVGGHTGNGVLEIALAGPVPSLAGTLAFQSFDLQAFMAAFMPLPGENALWSDAIDTDFAKQLDLDLRLSAARATAGQLTLMDVAATAQIKDGLGAFDISDASAFGGIIQAGFRVDQRGDNDQAEFRFLATDIDLQPFGTAAGLDGMLPQAKGTISTIIAGPADEWETLFARAEGSASVKVGPGTMPGIDIEAFRQRAGQGGFFPLRDIPRGTMAFDKAEFRATIARGIARLDVAKVEQPRQTIALTGILPLVGRGIALSGAILPRGTPEAPASAEPLAAFFVGGSWNAPFVSPILPNFPQE